MTGSRKALTSLKTLAKPQGALIMSGFNIWVSVDFSWIRRHSMQGGAHTKLPKPFRVVILRYGRYRLDVAVHRVDTGDPNTL